MPDEITTQSAPVSEPVAAPSEPVSAPSSEPSQASEAKSTPTKELSLSEQIAAAYDQASKEGVGLTSEGKKPQITEKKENTLEAKEPVKEVPKVDIKVPASWDKEAKDAFLKLPPDLQQVVSKREAQRESIINQKLREVAQKAEHYSSIDRILEPRAKALALDGIEPATYINQLVTAQEVLDADPVEGLRKIAASYGLDFSQLAKSTDSKSGNDLQTNPAIAELKAEIAQLKNVLGEQQQAATTQQLSALESQVIAFANAQTEKGEAQHPYFEEVQSEMLNLVTPLREQMVGASPKEILQAAYDKACWLNDSVRERLLDQQVRVRESKRISEEKERAQQAKRAGSSLTGAPHGSVSNTPPTDLRTALLQAFESAA